MTTPLRLLSSFTLACLFSVVAGCAVNPVTGKNELSLISAEQEVAIGAKNYGPSQQSQGGRYYIDPEIQVYVAGVGRKLAAVSDRSGLPYEFVVLNNPVPNAWAMPGGKIAVNSGLLWNLEDEAQLAAVLSHEIVHAAARHGASQMSRGVLVGIGTQIAGIAAQKAGYGELGGVAAQLGSAAWMAHYGRDDELESDAYGMTYMNRAGYDPLAAVELQETFVKLNKSRQQNFISGLFASHPPSQERVNKNRERAKTFPPGGVRNKALYQQKIARLTRDKPAYDEQLEAMKALNDKDGKKALAHLDKAVKIQPKDSYFWELRGHAWTLLKDTANAEKAFTTAIGKNPDLYSHYLARGILRYKNGNRNKALIDLEKSAQLLPTPTASYYLGEMANVRGDKSTALGYYQQAAQSSSPLGKTAQKKLVVLELESAPHKYIASKAYVGDDGYLRIIMQNNSGIVVTSIKVQLTEMRNSFIAGNSSTLRGPPRLTTGEKYVIKTRIALKNKDDARKYRSKVITAKPQ